MTILVPFKPVVLVLGFLSGWVFVGFVGSSLLEGKEPFVNGQNPNEAHACKAGYCTSNFGAQAF